MREGITVGVSAADRTRLEAIVANRNSRQKHVWRARIVLLTADGLGTKRDHTRGRRQQSHGVALAGAFHASGGRGSAA